MNVFCDHLTFMIPYIGPDILGGRMVEFDLDGDPKWEVNRLLPFEGSHSTKIHVKTVENPHQKCRGVGTSKCLYITGNPVKYFQGHNLWGTADIQSLIYDTTKEVLETIGIDCFTTLKILKSDMSDVIINRIDLTAMYELPTLSDVRLWLRSAISCASGRNQKTTSKNTTLYIGEYSESFTLLAYCKYDELQDKKHKLPDSFTPQQFDLLTKWSENKLRIELKFRRLKLLQMQMQDAYKWTPEVVMLYFFQTLKDKLILSGDLSMIPLQIELIEKKYQRVYHEWMGGADVLQLMSTATAYRYRKFFINQFGLDIFKTRPNLNANVIPLIRVLEAVPAAIPDQAYSMGLVYRPNSERG